MAEGRPPNNDICTIHDLLKLPDREPPKFKKPRMWSDELNDFLTKCLVKTPEERLSALDLLMVKSLRKMKKLTNYNC